MNIVSKLKKRGSIALGAILLLGAVSSGMAKMIQTNAFTIEYGSFWSNGGQVRTYVESSNMNPVSLKSVSEFLDSGLEWPFDGGVSDDTIGIATDDQSVDGTTYNWNGDSNQQFSLIKSDDFIYDNSYNSSGSIHDPAVNVGRSDSEHVANMFSYFLSNAKASSGVCFSNASNLKELTNNTCSNPMFANGMPTQLNFFFVVDINLSLTTYTNQFAPDETIVTTSVQCKNVVFAQQGDKPFGDSFFHAFASVLNAGVDVAEGIGDLAVTDGEEGYKTLGNGLVKTHKATKSVESWGASNHNPWWIGQITDGKSNNFAQYIPEGYKGPSTSLDNAASRAILTCTDGYLFVVEHDDTVYNNFIGTLVPYSIK